MTRRNENRIDRKFAQLKEQGKKALIPFVTAGDPSLEKTEELVLSMFAQGADLVELGVPFSDPIAEGPVIQEASLRALKGGVTLIGIFDLVRKLRKKTDEPLLLMLYVNSIFRFGTERFFDLCQETGVDGVIVPDLPFEERDEILPAARARGVYNISLVAPTSHDRIQRIAEEAEGFLYCVSSTGVTGVRQSFQTDFDQFFTDVQAAAKAPCCVGFGISSPEQARRMASYCDGVIVGSAIVQRPPEEIPAFVGDLAKGLAG